MDFKTKFDSYGHDPVYSVPGDPIKPVYSSYFDENGDIVVEITGKTDFQAMINSHRESCDLKAMIARYELGDPNALNNVPGMFFDASDMPKTYAEMFNRVKEAEDTFYNLPADIKEVFDNNPVKFFTEFGTEEATKKLAKLDRYNVPDKESEVKSNANVGTDE